jgi:hypothetical protein
MPPTSEQEWREAGKKSLDQLEHRIKRFNDRLTFDNPRLVERYVEGKLKLLLHFVASIGGSSENYVAHLRFAPGVSGKGERGAQYNGTGHIWEATLDEQLPKRLPDKNAVMHEHLKENAPVFVHDVQSMENPEHRLTTLARVDFVDCFYDLFTEGLYFSEGVGFLRLGVIVDREVNPLAFIGRISSTHEK